MIDKNFSIAVLVPTKNRKLLLERCLKSLFSQSVLPNEVVVVNDGSEDGTKNFLETLSEKQPLLKVINREKSGGVNVARNQAMSIIESQWVAWLDDDDEFVEEAIKNIKESLVNLPSNFNVIFFNSLIKTGEESFVGGFQFFDGCDFYDPGYEETMTKFGLKGDCKPVFKRSLLVNPKYKFPETVNGFESYTMNLLARDKKGIRYFKDITTVIHQEPGLKDRLSLNAPRKNPWPLLVLHSKQLFEHSKFYLYHPILFGQKIVTMLKLLIRTLVFFRH